MQISNMLRIRITLIGRICTYQRETLSLVLWVWVFISIYIYICTTTQIGMIDIGIGHRCYQYQDIGHCYSMKKQ